MTFSTLHEAIEWTRSQWAQQRPVPTRLHSREMESPYQPKDAREIGCVCLDCTTKADDGDATLGSHAFSGPFTAALEGDTFGYATVNLPDAACYHPTLVRGDSPRSCPECHGLGVKDHKTTLYFYPMGVALARLAAIAPNSLDRRHPHPYALVHALVSAGWDWRAAARSIDRSPDTAEALFLVALRKLRSRYNEGPVSTRTSAAKWTELSESAQNAIVAGETAA